MSPSEKHRSRPGRFSIQNERSALLEVLESGVRGGYSPKVKEFEARFAAAHQAEFGISACNGMLTLEAALLACGIRAGDEVIVPPISFVATATAVLRAGTVPVFADVQPETCNLDPERAGLRLRRELARLCRSISPDIRPIWMR